MKVIILGAGKTGERLARKLSEKNFNVTIVEKDKHTCEYLSETLNALVIHGNGAKSNILDESGVGKADIFLAVTGEDQTNLMSCALAKEIGAKRVICKLNDDDHTDIFQKLDIEILNLSEIAANILESIIVNDQLSNMTFVGAGKGIMVDIKLSKNSPLKDRKIIDIKEKIPADCIISAVSRTDGDIIIPHGNTILKEADTLTIVGKKQAILAFKEML